MTMGVKVYYSEISASKETKKRQQRVMMILDSKVIPYESIDITEPGKEGDKDFMLNNAKPRGDSKKIFSPQIFNGEVYCGDYEDFDLANENDSLEDFLNVPKSERKFSVSQNNGNVENGKTSRESSAEAEAKKAKPDEEPKAEESQPEEASPTPAPAESAAPVTTTSPTDYEEEDAGFNEKNVGESEKAAEGEGEVSSTSSQQQAANPADERGEEEIDDGIVDDKSQED